jgi:hypothetical protein
MDYEELRPMVLEAIGRVTGSSLQLVTIIDETDKVAHSKGFYQNATPWGLLDR